MSWIPAQYLKYSEERLRPALDLLARIPEADYAQVYDLGCGAGNATLLLKQRWPGAHVVGIDSSPEMLRKARALDGVEWVQQDVRHWAAPAPADVLFSNAVFHWVDSHERLFPRLMQQLRPGGMLAVQMPRNFAEPSHKVLYELMAEPQWANRLGPEVQRGSVASPEAYREWLQSYSSEIDIWETVYWHWMEGADPVVEWMKGTTLTPILDRFADADEDDERREFLRVYGERLRASYPPGPDGRTAFSFRRLFIVARRR